MNTSDQQPVLITGASGFIGMHLARLLVARGRRVSCLVRPTSDVKELLAAGVELVTGDVNDRAAVSRVIASSNARVVFHLAGLVRAMSSAEFMRVNAEGVEAVAAACMERPEPPLLVLVSSLAAAGPSGAVPRTESDPPLPVSDYGRSKLAGEQAAARYAGGLPITIVRPGAVFGAGDRGMYEVFNAVARSGMHVVCGRGDRRISLIAVADLVECIVLAAEKGERLVPGDAGRGIYLAGAEDLSHVELGSAIAHALGKRVPRIVRVPGGLMRLAGLCGDVVTRIRRNPGWVNSDKVSELLAGSWTCSSAKARRQLGWLPAAPLADRLRETAQWYFDARWLQGPVRPHSARS
jgi:nucleoside-diphosphate-sugar epimerase